MIERSQNPEHFIVPDIETKVGVESDTTTVREKLKKDLRPIEFVLTKGYGLFLTDKGYVDLKKANGLDPEDINVRGWVVRKEGVLSFTYYSPDADSHAEDTANRIPKNLKNAIKHQVESFIRPPVALKQEQPFSKKETPRQEENFEPAFVSEKIKDLEQIPEIEAKTGVETTSQAVRSELAKDGGSASFVLTDDFRLFLSDQNAAAIHVQNGIDTDEISVQSRVFQKNGKLLLLGSLPSKLRLAIQNAVDLFLKGN